ncbi:transposase (plasmid) [Ensifer sp. R-19]
MALTFVAAVDGPERFRSSRAVEPHFGLTPKKYQSGETDHSGRISKIGDGSVRTVLYEVLTRPVKGSDLKGWRWPSPDVPVRERRASRWPASWRWCCIACSGTEPSSSLIRERQPWRLDRRRRQDRLSDGHSHQPSAARSLRRDDGWVRPLCDQQHAVTAPF